MTRSLISVLIVFVFLFPAFASQKAIWVESIGEAYLGEVETPKEVKERAKKNAQQKAVEKAVGVFIKAHTLVSNSQIADDLIYASVRGRIEKSEVIQGGWDEEDRKLYRIKIKSLIKPVYPEKGEGLLVKVFLSKTQLNEGEKVKIFYEANNDCYIYIFSVAADGSVTLLLPNSMHQNNFIKAKDPYEFPSSGGLIHLTAMFLPGYKGNTAEERIKLIVTKKREGLLPLGFREGVFQVYDKKSTGMISDLVKRLNRIDPTDWAEATAAYTLSR